MRISRAYYLFNFLCPHVNNRLVKKSFIIGEAFFCIKAAKVVFLIWKIFFIAAHQVKTCRKRVKGKSIFRMRGKECFCVLPFKYIYILCLNAFFKKKVCRKEERFVTDWFICITYFSIFADSKKAASCVILYSIEKTSRKIRSNIYLRRGEDEAE